MKKYRRRAHFTETEKARIWDRWQRGNSLHKIARLLNTSYTSVHRNLALTCGIRPPQRNRSRLALTLAEREEISRGLATRRSLRFIATKLGRAPSTISREVRLETTTRRNSPPLLARNRR